MQSVDFWNKIMQTIEIKKQFIAFLEKEKKTVRITLLIMVTKTINITKKSFRNIF